MKSIVISYAHGGYCSGNTNSIEVYEECIPDVEGYEIINNINNMNCVGNITSKDDLAKYITESFDIPAYDKHNNCLQVISINDEIDKSYENENENGNKKTYIIKCEIYDIGSGYCDTDDNKHEFVGNKYYDSIISKIDIGDLYIILERI